MPFIRLAADLVSALRAVGVDAHILLLHGDLKQLAAEFPGVPFALLGVSRSLWATFALRRYVRRERPDVVYSYPHLVNFSAILARRSFWGRSRLLIGEHGIFSKESTIEWRGDTRFRWIGRLMRWFYRFADGLIGVSEAAVADLRDECGVHLPARQWSFLNPIDAERIRLKAARPLEDGQKGFPEGTALKLLACGRLAAPKNHAVLIEAAAQLRNSGLEFHLIILGEGPLREQVESQVRAANLQAYVSLPGVYEQPYSLIQDADIFVMPSRWDVCPLALLEAMALERACIGSDGAGAISHLLAEDAGIVVGYDDASAFAAAIVRLANDPKARQAYGSRARQRVGELADHRVVAQHYLAAFSSILAE